VVDKYKIAFSIMLLSTTLYSIDISKLSPNDIIEVIQINNKQTIKAVEDNNTHQPIYYTPTTNNYEIKFKKKSYDTEYGPIEIYDLSQNNKYLNAINYTNMIIDGNISECKLAISDKKLFHKEDNLILDNNHNIDFSKIYNKIDLSRLKYIILFKTAQCNINKLTLIDNKKPIKPSNFKRSIWVWKPSNIKNEDKLDKFDIDTLYIQMNKDFNTTLKLLTNRYTYGLNGSPSDIYNSKHLLDDINSLAKLKQQYKNIIGYQVDIEPYLLKEYNQNRDEILSKYIKVLKLLHKTSNDNGLRFSVVMPFWFSNVYFHNKNLAQIVIDIADEVVLMSYRSDLKNIIKISKNSLSMGYFSHTDIKIGIELMKIDDEIHTFYTIISNQCLKNNKLDNDCLSLQQINQYTVYGNDISFYNQFDKLKHLNDLQIPSKAFRGFVLHYYDKLPSVSF